MGDVAVGVEGQGGKGRRQNGVNAAVMEYRHDPEQVGVAGGKRRAGGKGMEQSLDQLFFVHRGDQLAARIQRSSGLTPVRIKRSARGTPAGINRSARITPVGIYDRPAVTRG